jgi:hypothetical protein
MARMNEDELKAITDAEIRTALGYGSGKLSFQRQKAIVYYYGEPELDLSPPEIAGRSSVVSPDVRNTIESMLPQLMYKFSGSEKVVEFEPTKPEDEGKAQQATDYINWLYHYKNPGVKITYTWIKDALLSKNGIVKVWWDNRNEETKEEYRALNKVELAQVMDDDEVEVTEQLTYPDEEDAKQRLEAIEQLTAQLAQAQQAAMQNPQAAQAVQQITAKIAEIQAMEPAMLYDITCKRTKTAGKVCVENVPPEEFLISRNAKDIKSAPFVGHRVMRTISELKSMGYKDADQIQSDDANASFNMERIQRNTWDDDMAYQNMDDANTMDPSQRVVWVVECYLRVDFDGDGIAELRKVTRAGNRILDNEIVDVVPFVSITPVPLPHRFFGLSIADLAMESQKTKTSILRAQLDNMYLQVNGRYFAVEGQVNLDDLMTSRPGGIVRTKNPQAVGRLDQGMGNGNDSMMMMEYMHTFLEDSTGWSRNSAGTDPNALDQTATAANIVTNKADMRVDLIARNMAEGFCELFRQMLKLVCQYQNKKATIRLDGKWFDIDPREWFNQFDTSINVGLGNGNRDQQVGHMNVLMSQQKEGLMLGITQPSNVYESAKELTKLLGFRSPDRFFVKPPPGPLPPPPNPEQMKAQTAKELKQMEMQDSAQKFQAETLMTREIEAIKSQAKLQETRMQLELQAANDARDSEREKLKAQYDAQLEKQRLVQEERLAQLQADVTRWKTDQDNNTKIVIAGMNKPAEEVDEMGNKVKKPDPTESINTVIQELQALRAEQSAPRQIVRGPDGRVAGISINGAVRPVQRDQSGNVVGI